MVSSTWVFYSAIRRENQDKKEIYMSILFFRWYFFVLHWEGGLWMWSNFIFFVMLQGKRQLHLRYAAALADRAPRIASSGLGGTTERVASPLLADNRDLVDTIIQ